VAQNEEGIPQEPRNAPAEEPSAEEPPESDKAILAPIPKEPHDAPDEEPNAEEPPGPATLQPHGPMLSRPESNEDDGHLHTQHDKSSIVPQEPQDAPAEEQNVEEPKAEPNSKTNQCTDPDPTKTPAPAPILTEPPPVKITIKLVSKFGLTRDGCHACTLGGPVAHHHSHEPECRRRFAHLAAGRPWPPPRSPASASAALVALLREPESEPEPRRALIASYVSHYDSPGLSLIKANQKTQELREYEGDGVPKYMLSTGGGGSVRAPNLCSCNHLFSS